MSQTASHMPAYDDVGKTVCGRDVLKVWCAAPGGTVTCKRCLHGGASYHVPENGRVFAPPNSKHEGLSR